MKIRQFVEKRRQEYLTRLLQGKSFEEACRTYVLKMRSPQYLSHQPIERDDYINGKREHFFQKTQKHFPGDDPAQKHCYSREELISEAAHITGSDEKEAISLLHRLFEFQPELAYSNRGAVCKNDPVFGLESADIKMITIPYDILAKQLPDEWYISLQVPEPVIARMIWGCRKTGSPEPHPCSSRFAENLLRLYKRRRGEFIRQYSFETLKYFWLEYGSMKFPQSQVEQIVGKILASAENPVR